MNKNLLYKLDLCILQELFFICCLTRGIWFTPWFPYIKKHDTLHSVCISSGNKEGATKTSFSCTDLFFHYINHPVYSAPFLGAHFYHLDSQLDYNSRTVRYCLVYFYRVSHIEMNHLRIRINDFVYLRLDCIVQIFWEANKRLPHLPLIIWRY